MKDRWFLPLMCLLFALAGYMSCQSCRVWQSTAQGAEFLNHGTAANRVRISAENKQDARLVAEASRGYAGGKPISISVEESTKHESVYWDLGDRLNVRIRAPRSYWPELVAAVCGRPHKCTGNCQNYFEFRTLKP